MKIIADTATLIAPSEGNTHGLTVIPVCVAIHNRTYQDYSEISSSAFIEMIRQGGVPSSSQPAIGDLLDAMDSSEEEMLVITVGDGLSGGYQTAMGARNLASDPQRIQVLDSKTLAGPLRYLAKKAVSLKEQHLSMEQIKANLQWCIDSSVSFVIPEDFEFLKRSGRLTPFYSKGWKRAEAAANSDPDKRHEEDLPHRHQAQLALCRGYGTAAAGKEENRRRSSDQHLPCRCAGKSAAGAGSSQGTVWNC